MALYINIIIVSILLLVSAFFSACETAITAYSKPKMYNMASEGNKMANLVLSLQSDIGLVISAILTCATLLNAMAVAVTTDLFTEMLGDYAIIFAPIVTSIFIVLFAEVLPKMYTITDPIKILLPSVRIINYTYVALRPLNRIIGFIAHQLMKLIKTTKRTTTDELNDSIDELKGAIALHKGKDINDTNKEKEMLNSVLALSNLTVGEIMTHRKNVTMICADNPIEDIIKVALETSYTRIPLWSKNPDNIVGVLHVKDLLRYLRLNSGSAKINIVDIAMKPRFIPESKDLLSQLQSFRTNHEHFALVIDEYGSFFGIVTLEDIIEEIVGDIEDEHDITHPNGIITEDDGSYIVDGIVNIRDLNREIGTNFTSDTASTIAGLVINSIGIIPLQGQIFIINGYRFEILRRQRAQVTKMRMQRVGDIK